MKSAVNNHSPPASDCGAGCAPTAKADRRPPLLILGNGPLSRRWHDRLKIEDWPVLVYPGPQTWAEETRDHPPIYRAGLWENSLAPKPLHEQLALLPSGLPLLLRYCRPLTRPQRQRLLQTLRQRRTTILFSRPWRWRPPLCRAWEIIATGVLGDLRRIEIEIGLAEFSASHRQTACFDALDLATAIFGALPQTAGRRRFNHGEEFSLEFDSGRETTIRIFDREHPTAAAGAAASLLGLTACGDRGEIALRPRPEEMADRPALASPGRVWRLTRRFPDTTTSRPPQDLLISDADPTTLELHEYLPRLLPLDRPRTPDNKSGLLINQALSELGLAT